MCMFGNGFGIGGMWLAGIFHVLIWIAILWVVVWGIRYFMNQKQTPADKKAVEILHDRYAKGEINESEYEERMKILNRN
ncbi:SHOCT domain-containing protein [Sporosarcina soli]|uniref:SHOCT domain-containing protein n=1 Tax=Sporosarcina soli TaxID=334736 RepID=A0ABW0TTA2_9BACL